MGVRMTISWKAVEEALNEPIPVSKDFSWRLTRAFTYYWGQLLVRGRETFVVRSGMIHGQMLQIEQALAELNKRHAKAMGMEIGFDTVFPPRIRAQFGNLDLRSERHQYTIDLDLTQFTWEPLELELIGMLGAKKVGHLCQRRRKEELLPAAEYLGMGKQGLGAMEVRFQGHILSASEGAVFLCFDMDLPSAYSEVYPRTPEAPPPQAEKPRKPRGRRLAQ